MPEPSAILREMPYLRLIRVGAIVAALACCACNRSASDDPADTGPSMGAGSGALVQTLPFTGTLLLDEYNWFPSSGDLIAYYVGVIEIELPSGRKARVLEGRHPMRHPSGTTVYIQGCGASAGRVMLAGADGLTTPVTPCSSEAGEVVERPESELTRFAYPKLSPDQRHIALQAYHYWEDSLFLFYVAVYDVDGNWIRSYPGFHAAWTPDGQLVVSNDGLYLTQAPFTGDAIRISGDQLNSPVYHPNVHPAGDRVIFEYNLQLWEMNLDGTNPHEVVRGSVQLKYPTYSPDGNAVAYLGVTHEDEYEQQIFFTDLAQDEHFALDLSGTFGDVTLVPNGPMTWLP